MNAWAAGGRAPPPRDHFRHTNFLLKNWADVFIHYFPKLK